MTMSTPPAASWSRSSAEDGWLSADRARRRTARRSTCARCALARETLARHDGLADFAFAMQGLGAGPISLFGSDAQRAAWLPRTRAGDGDRRLRADRAGLRLRRRQYRHDRAARRRGLRARRREDLDLERRHRRLLRGVRPHRRSARRARPFGLHRRGRQSGSRRSPNGSTVIAPHPLARLRFDNCRVPAAAMIGKPGEGFKIAMATLDVFRTTVGAAALGFARRALDETVKRVATRRAVRRADGRIADGAGPPRRHGAGDRRRGAAGLPRRLDQGSGRRARHPRGGDGQALSPPKRAQRVIDAAVQLHGGDGVRAGHPVETLYREIRALRIYEGASDVQKIVIARAVSRGGVHHEQIDQLGPIRACRYLRARQPAAVRAMAGLPARPAGIPVSRSGSTSASN